MKKMMCILLSLVLTAAMIISASADDIRQDATTVDEVLAQYESQTGEKPETYRYYFIIPDGIHGMHDEEGNVVETWYNAYSQGACVFWWQDAPVVCDSWPGYQAKAEDAEHGIWYVDLPATVEIFIWNNGISDEDKTLNPMQKLTVSLFSSYADPDEYDTIPEGCENFDHCIFVTEPDYHFSELLNRPFDGSWYFYYGNGCYGNYAQESEHFTSASVNCCNPDHYDENGNHVGYTPSLRGDYDWDNDITIMDATRAQYILADLYTGSNPAHITAADADGDGELTIMDATRIQYVLAELMDMGGKHIAA